MQKFINGPMHSLIEEVDKSVEEGWKIDKIIPYTNGDPWSLGFAILSKAEGKTFFKFKTRWSIMVIDLNCVISIGTRVGTDEVTITMNSKSESDNDCYTLDKAEGKLFLKEWAKYESLNHSSV